MKTADPVRRERSFEAFSRGAELVRDIRAMWEEHRSLPFSSKHSEILNGNIEALREEYDLTYPEWYYWSKRSSDV